MNFVTLPKARTDIVTVVIIILQTACNFGAVEVDMYEEVTQSYMRVWKT